MKTLLLILAFVSLPLITIAQEDNSTATTEISVEKDVKEAIETIVVKKESFLNSAVKAQILKINRKKSNEIISIKAYRKSLQIKVKEIKLC